MENRLQFLLRKNAGKRYLETYKDILSKPIVDGSYNIIGLEETDVISEKIKKNQITLQDNNLIWTDKHIPFVEKNELKRIISGIQSRNNDIVYMSIKNSDLCGLVVLNRFVSNSAGKYVLIDSDGAYGSKSWKEMIVRGIAVNRPQQLKSLEWIREMSLNENCIESHATHDARIKPHVIVL